MVRIDRKTWLVRFVAVMIATAAGMCFGQSTSQEFPTAVVSNELSGTIKARDLGDSRLTTYYYALNGDQGDLFINLVTRNFTGDIDVFTVNGLKPMTKIVVYADYGDVETGRAIYLRKPEKLILRIQGRTPNDDAATFRLKFAGSFVAAKVDEAAAEPEAPKVSSESRGSVRVNSVGTILPPLPKPVETSDEKSKDTDAIAKAEDKAETKPGDAVETPETTAEPKRKAGLEIVVTDPTEENAKTEKVTTKPTTTARRRATKRPTAKKTPEKPAEETTAEAVKTEPAKPAETSDPSFDTLLNKRRARTTKSAKPAKTPPPEAKPDPLASINLVIQFKDGNSLEKKMSEVFKFSVDKGILTVILKDGSINKYPIINVAKVTIE